MVSEPRIGSDTLGDFWGGYRIEFKVMPSSEFEGLQARPDRRPVRAWQLGPGDKRAYSVDISKHEYCGGYITTDVDGYTLRLYSEHMIACEKLRAICQQMPEYRRIVHSRSASPRPRDFFDIHTLVTSCGFSLSDSATWNTLTGMFNAKRVPLALLGRISEHRDFHRQGFSSLRDTVDKRHGLREFDEYVDFVVEAIRGLKPFWEEQPPA